MTTQPDTPAQIAMIDITAELTWNGTVHATAITMTAAEYDSHPTIADHTQKNAAHIAHHRLHDQDPTYTMNAPTTITTTRYLMDLTGGEA